MTQTDKTKDTNFNMWCEDADDDLFCAVKDGIDYQIFAVNNGPKSDPDITIDLVNIINKDGDEIETTNYPSNFEYWLWDYFYEMPVLDPIKLGWEPNRFKETL